MDRRKFTREFTLEAVKLIQERRVTVAQAARDLGVHGTMLRRWIRDGTAGSTSERNTCREYSRWRLKPQRLPWALVQS